MIRHLSSDANKCGELSLSRCAIESLNASKALGSVIAACRLLAGNKRVLLNAWLTCPILNFSCIQLA